MLKQTISTLTISVMLASSPIATAGLASYQITPPNIGSVNRLIIKLRSSDTSQNILPAQRQAQQVQIQRTIQTQVESSTGLNVKQQHSRNDDLHIVELQQTLNLDEAKAYAAQLQAHPDIEFVEPDARRYALNIITNDPYYSNQSYLHSFNPSYPTALNLPAAWSLEQGDPNIRIAVVDTGILDHSDLSNNLHGGTAIASGYDFISEASNAADGDGRDSNPTDEGDSFLGNPSSWHGTFVSGIIGADTDNARGVSGINWHSKIINTRVLGKSGGLVSDINDAIRWAAGISIEGIPDNPYPAKIINLSLGALDQCSYSEQSAILQANARGAIVVVASGNEGVNAKLSSPANCEGVIVTGALAGDGSRATYSNYGAKVHISTIGNDIYSTSNAGFSSATSDNYHIGSGTSFANGVTSGVISLMLSANSHLTDGTIPLSQVSEVIKSKLQASARPFPSTLSYACDTNDCGAGILDAEAAILAVSTPPTAFAGADQFVTAGARVQLNAQSSSDDGQIKAYHWQQIAGATVELQNPNAALASFTAPGSGEYRFALSVTDDVGLVSENDETITVFVTPSLRSFFNVPLNQSIESMPITLYGDGSNNVISIENGEYSLNGANFTDQPGHFINGDHLVVRHTSANTFSTETQTLLSTSYTSSIFSTTTIADQDNDEDGISNNLDVAPNDASYASLNYGLNDITLSNSQMARFRYLKLHSSSASFLPDNNDLTFPYGVIQYAVETPVSGTVTMYLNFPERLATHSQLYQVTAAGYKPIEHATVSANQASISLQDGSEWDEDADSNGMIYGLLAIANPAQTEQSATTTNLSQSSYTSSTNSTSGGGGAFSVLLMLLGLLTRFRTYR